MTDRSEAVLLLWVIVISIAFPFSVCPRYVFRFVQILVSSGILESTYAASFANLSATWLVTNMSYIGSAYLMICTRFGTRWVANFVIGSEREGM